MAKLSLWLFALIAPFIKQILVVLGVGLVTYVGFDQILSSIQASITSMWGGLPADAWNILALAGFVQAVNIWLSALTTSLALLALKKYTLMTS